MATKKELLERKATLVGEIRKIGDAITEKDEHGNARGFKDAEQRAKWEQVNKDYDALNAELKSIEDQESIRSRLDELDADRRERETRDNPRRPRGGGDEVTDEDRNLAFQAWVLAPSGDLSERHDEACRKLGFNPGRRILNIPLRRTIDVRGLKETMRQVHIDQRQSAGAEYLDKRSLGPDQRNLSVGFGAKGGATVPMGMINALEVNMLAYGGMLQVADLWRTERGDEVPWPTADDTSNEGEQVGEGASIGDSVDPSFGARIFRAYKFSSKLIKCSSELIEDSAFDMPAVIGRMAGERLGRVSNRKFTTGSGAGTPRGITEASTLGVTSAASAAIAADEIFDLVHSVDPAYRSGPGVGFMFHDNILLHFRQLKDGEGQYLWQPGLRAGTPDLLVGYQYTINQHMASAIASGNKTMLFGDLSKYKVRQVRSVRFRRLDELYGGTDEVGFIAFFRQDGDLLDAGTAPVKHLIQV